MHLSFVLYCFGLQVAYGKRLLWLQELHALMLILGSAQVKLQFCKSACMHADTGTWLDKQDPTK